jgi:NADH-quinone oxidoreductase subunit D
MGQMRTETMTVNMGPQHPSTHGVLRLVLELDGETVVSATPAIGYLHTGIEKTAEQKRWQQVIPLVERMDYLGGQTQSLAFCLSVERLLGLEIPERVQWIRVLIAELQRINSHLVWLGTHVMDMGAITVMLYAFRERELLLNINEMIAGFRLFPSYFRVGGLREDLPPGFHDAVTAFLDRMPGKLVEYQGLLNKNTIFQQRTRGVGVLSRSEATAWGLVGPMARGSGSTYDVRRAFPYLVYDRVEFDVQTRTEGDVYARYLVRLGEITESLRICRQALAHVTPTGPWAVDDPRITPPPKDKVYTEMEALIQHFLIYSQGFTVPAGEACVPLEGPRGELSMYVVSDGGNRPWRVKCRPPSFYATQAMPHLLTGGLIADAIAVIGSTDIVLGDVDR